MTESSYPKVLNAGADAVMVCFSERIEEAANERVTALQQQLLHSALPLTDMVPAYSTLMLYYDVTQLSEAALRQALEPMLQDVNDAPSAEGSLHTLDVYYGDDVGPDWQRVMDSHHLSKQELIEKHTAQPFRVFALGFAPGFGYMGILPEALVTPRLQRPREKIPAGSVAVAEQQTAVYPVDSPGGWNIIGRTATPLYQPEQGILSAFEVGDYVQFRAISRQQFIEQGGNPEALHD